MKMQPIAAQNPTKSQGMSAFASVVPCRRCAICHLLKKSILTAGNISDPATAQCESTFFRYYHSDSYK
jgi:hypothetical protein